MSGPSPEHTRHVGALGPPPVPGSDSSRTDDRQALGCPRHFFEGSSHVYAVVSSRARGLSVGLNLNPDRFCNFDCCYCEVDRLARPEAGDPIRVDARNLARELAVALARVEGGQLRRHPSFAALPPDMLRPVHVAISGDGEPTLCPNFAEAVESVIHLRAAGLSSYFKLVLLTNATALDRPSVRDGLRLFTRSDEVWAKLDAGTQAFMDRINRTAVPLETVLRNILDLGRRRPVVIQSMFVELDGLPPDPAELAAYARRLVELQEADARISLVQIYSATRFLHSNRCRHLSLRALSEIAGRVHRSTGLPVEVF